MIENVNINYDKNKDIIKSISVVRKNEEPNSNLIESTFYYKVSKESELFFHEDGFYKVTLSHENPIDYDKFHKKFIPLDYALGLHGYSLNDDNYEWENKLKKDNEFFEDIKRIMNFFEPITKEEYIKK